MTPEALIVPALRGDDVAWPERGDDLSRAVLDAAAAHGVAPLLWKASGIAGWPDAVREELRTRWRAEAAVEALRRESLGQLLDSLASAGIEVLVVKGAQLAYTHYAEPWLRPRLDTDLLIRNGDRAGAEQVLRTLGYRPGTYFDGELVTQQFQYRRDTRAGIADVVDLHWRLANPHVLAGALPFDELARHARPIPALGPSARGLADAHALLLACVHRVAHHDRNDRLVWLYDIHLLARTLPPSAWDAIAELARQQGLRAICADGLERVRDCFGTALPAALLERLRQNGAPPEPAAVLLRSGRRQLDDLLTDLRSLPRRRDRLRLLREHVLPPAAYIRQAYGVRHPVLVAIAYASRLAGGGAWFRRRSHPQ